MLTIFKGIHYQLVLNWVPTFHVHLVWFNLMDQSQVYYWIGWKPDKSQPKPLRPQKSDVSQKLKDLSLNFFHL